MMFLLPHIIACSSKMYNPQITNQPFTEEGTIFLRSSGFGVTKKDAYNDAVKHAFNTLCFQGVPESIQSRPLIDNEDKQRSSNLEQCFVDKSCYEPFTTSISQVNEGEKVRNGYAALLDIKINIRAFRSYLENKNVIRKFGY